MASRSSLICAVVTAKSDVVDCRTVWGKLGENAVAMVAVRARAAATFMVMIICGLLWCREGGNYEDLLKRSDVMNHRCVVVGW